MGVSHACAISSPLLPPIACLILPWAVCAAPGGGWRCRGGAGDLDRSNRLGRACNASYIALSGAWQLGNGRNVGTGACGCLQRLRWRECGWLVKHSTHVGAKRRALSARGRGLGRAWARALGRLLAQGAIGFRR